MRQHRESPTKRVNPSGKVVWIARYTPITGGSRQLVKPRATFKVKGPCKSEHDGCCAQHAIDAAYDRTAPKGQGSTLGTYAKTWTARHPRSARTNTTNDHRLSRVLAVEVEDVPLRDWPLSLLRRRHANDLVDHMLRVQGRAPTGAANILRSLSALCEDAITDELAETNPFKGVKVRGNDPRATKRARKPRVFTFAEMHGFAAAAGAAAWKGRRPDLAPMVQAMVRTFSDGGMRLGEVLPLERPDLTGECFRVRGTAHDGTFTEGSTDTKDHDRTVPCPPSLAALIGAMPVRIDTPLLYPTPMGKLWRERNFYRDVWHPTVEATGMRCSPQDFRHSYVTHLRAAGIHDADLAQVTGHSVETMLARYTHPVEQSFELIRSVIG